MARLLAIKHGGSVVCANGERGGAGFTVEIQVSLAAAESGAPGGAGREGAGRCGPARGGGAPLAL